MRTFAIVMMFITLTIITDGVVNFSLFLELFRLVCVVYFLYLRA